MWIFDGRRLCRFLDTVEHGIRCSGTLSEKEAERRVWFGFSMCVFIALCQSSSVSSLLSDLAGN